MTHVVRLVVPHIYTHTWNDNDYRTYIRLDLIVEECLVAVLLAKEYAAVDWPYLRRALLATTMHSSSSSLCASESVSVSLGHNRYRDT
jgi:hypothetical protein